MLGDICYIKVVPCDGADFYITASTEGYFVNKVGKIALQLSDSNIHVINCLIVGVEGLW